MRYTSKGKRMHISMQGSGKIKVRTGCWPRIPSLALGHNHVLGLDVGLGSLGQPDGPGD